jgi:hypothetical protein
VRASTSLFPVAPLLGRDPRAKDRNSGDDQQRGQPPGKKDRGQPDDEDREARHVQDDSRPHVDSVTPGARRSRVVGRPEGPPQAGRPQGLPASPARPPASSLHAHPREDEPPGVGLRIAGRLPHWRAHITDERREELNSKTAAALRASSSAPSSLGCSGTKRRVRISPSPRSLDRDANPPNHGSSQLPKSRLTSTPNRNRSTSLMVSETPPRPTMLNMWVAVRI